ncbi:MAG: putative lipoic acid-binding regulatory protein [Granulosicoccus sp.]
MTDTLIEFPADLAVKAMGVSAGDFETLIASLVLPHIEPDPVTFTTLPSKEGKYVSVSIRFIAKNIEQLEMVYSALKAEPRVLFTL